MLRHYCDVVTLHAKTASHGHLYVAIISLIAATCVSGFAYARIAQQEKAKSAEFVLLREGDRSHLILNENLNGGNSCVGSFRVNLIEDRVYTLSGDGWLRAVYNNSFFDSRFNFEYYFNPLGQLNDGYLHLEALGLELTLRNRNAAPILVELAWKFKEREHRQSLRFPGPITLVKVGQGTGGRIYQLEHELLARLQLQNAANMSGSLISRSVLERLALSIRDVSNRETSCPIESAAALDVSALVDSLRTLLGSASLLHNFPRETS